MRGIDWYIMCIYQVGNGPYPSGTGRTQCAQCVTHWMELGTLTAGRSQRERVALKLVIWVRVALVENGSFPVESEVVRGRGSYGNAPGLGAGRTQWERVVPRGGRHQSVQFSPTSINTLLLCTNSDNPNPRSAVTDCSSIKFFSCVEI